MPDISDTVNKVEKEQQAKAQPKESPLEKKANGGFFKKIIDFGYMGLTTAAAWAIAGPINLVSVTGTYLLVHSILNRKNLKYKGLRKELHVGNAMTIYLFNMFKLLNKIANPITKSLAVLGIAMPIFNAFYLPVRYIISKYTPFKFLKDVFTLKIFRLPKEIINLYKRDYIKSLKRVYLISPVVLYAVNFTQFKYQLPVTSIGRFFYRLALGKGGEPSYEDEKKRE